MTNFVKKTSAALIAAAAVSFGSAMAQEETGMQRVPAVQKLAAVVLGVEDLDTSVAFYANTLNMSVVRTTSTDEYDEAILATGDAEGTKIVLYEGHDDTAEPKSARVVFYTSDAAAFIDIFRDQGLEIVREADPIAEGSPVRIGIAKDMDGHTLEFIQRS